MPPLADHELILGCPECSYPGSLTEQSYLVWWDIREQLRCSHRASRWCVWAGPRLRDEGFFFVALYCRYIKGQIPRILPSSNYFFSTNLFHNFKTSKQPRKIPRKIQKLYLIPPIYISRWNTDRVLTIQQKKSSKSTSMYISLPTRWRPWLPFCWEPLAMIKVSQVKSVHEPVSDPSSSAWQYHLEEIS